MTEAGDHTGGRLAIQALLVGDATYRTHHIRRSKNAYKDLLRGLPGSKRSRMELLRIPHEYRAWRPGNGILQGWVIGEGHASGDVLYTSAVIYLSADGTFLVATESGVYEEPFEGVHRASGVGCSTPDELYQWLVEDFRLFRFGAPNAIDPAAEIAWAAARSTYPPLGDCPPLGLRN